MQSSFVVIVIKHSCVRVFLSFTKSTTSSSGGRGGGAVLLMFLNSCLMWPFAVLVEGGRCFCINSTVRPGHEDRYPNLIALISVEGLGENHEACKNCANSDFFVSVRSMINAL